jgi:uncharacterized coiled-coil DUF342 family protein
MADVEQQLLRVEDKIQQLLKQYQSAQKEVIRLQKENAKLSNDLQTRTKQVDELHQKIDTLRLNTLSMDAEARNDFEKRINAYLKEIDNCLALLNS